MNDGPLNFWHALLLFMYGALAGAMGMTLPVLVSASKQCPETVEESMTDPRDTATILEAVGELPPTLDPIALAELIEALEQLARRGTLPRGMDLDDLVDLAKRVRRGP